MERKIIVFLLVGLLFVINNVQGGDPCDTSKLKSCEVYTNELKTISRPTLKQVCDAHKNVRKCFGDCKTALDAYDRVLEATVPGFAAKCVGCMNKPGVFFLLVPAIFQIVKKLY